MKILAYAPSVQVYAAIRTSASKIEYKDLSGDVVQCNVVRKTDAASTFSIRLQNVNHKYNGVFEPFDQVTILATKKEQVRLISGYITKSPKFTTYGGDITIEGMCPLYRLQQLYWDPKLRESLLLLGYEGAETKWDNVLFNLLTKVGGYSSSQVLIGKMPDDVIQYAYDMYNANRSSSEQLKSMLDEFYEVLQTHGPQLSGDDGGGNGITGVSEDQNKIIKVAKNYTDYGIVAEGGMCAKWVSDVWQKAGFTRPGGNAIDFWNSWKSTGSTDISTAPLASVLVGSGVGSDGAKYGHVGIKTGADEVRSCVGDDPGGVKAESIESFYSWQTATCQGHKGKVGWVIPPGPTFGSSGGSYSGIDMTLSESEFVKKWGTRINSYLKSNYPNGALSGHGDTIAREARKNGCDPRIIVAISVAETGAGTQVAWGGRNGAHNYWSWGNDPTGKIGIFATTVDGAIAEFCQKFAKQYAGKSPEECADMGYGEKDYIMEHWQKVIDAI